MRAQDMQKIASFTVNHLNLLPGVYVSRRDLFGGQPITSYDLRMTRPNFEPVMNTAEIHAIEHLGASFLRNHPEYASRVVYFGPMGCRTGFYLLLHGEESSEEIFPLIRELFCFIRDFEGEIPGARAQDCGNYLDMNLDMARWQARRYLEQALDQPSPEQLRYRQ